MRRRHTIVVAAVLLIGCGTTQLFESIPPTLDVGKVRKQFVDMTAEHVHFTPEDVYVEEGSLISMNITSIDGSHGFALGAFGIDIELKENETKTVEFYVAKKGEYKFTCSHFCGLGHLGMNGKIIVE